MVKRIFINRLIFDRFNCLYLLVSMIDFHRLGIPGFNQGHSSGSNDSLIRYKHHVWREQFRESRDTFQETFEHIVFVSLASTPKHASVEKQFFQVISTFGRRLSQRATRLAAVFIRTSYTISRGCLTLRNFPVIKRKKQWACLTR